MSRANGGAKTRFQKLLDLVERLGNKVPHPAVLFFLLIVAVVVLSHFLYLMGTSATYERINLETHAPETATTSVNSLLTADGTRYLFTSVVRTMRFSKHRI